MRAVTGTLGALLGMAVVATGLPPADAEPSRSYDMNALVHERLPDWWLHPDAPTLRAQPGSRGPSELPAAVPPLEPLPQIPNTATEVPAPPSPLAGSGATMPSPSSGGNDLPTVRVSRPPASSVGSAWGR